jgi:hypothetical protein
MHDCVHQLWGLFYLPCGKITFIVLCTWWMKCVAYKDRLHWLEMCLFWLVVPVGWIWMPACSSSMLQLYCCLWLEIPPPRCVVALPKELSRLVNHTQSNPSLCPHMHTIHTVHTGDNGRQHLYNTLDIFNATILYAIHGPTTGFVRKYVGYQISFQSYSWSLVNA